MLIIYVDQYVIVPNLEAPAWKMASGTTKVQNSAISQYAHI